MCVKCVAYIPGSFHSNTSHISIIFQSCDGRRLPLLDRSLLTIIRPEKYKGTRSWLILFLSTFDPSMALSRGYVGGLWELGYHHHFYQLPTSLKQKAASYRNPLLYLRVDL